MSKQRTTTIGTLVEEGALEFGDGYRTKRPELGTPGLPILRVAEVLDGRISPAFTDHVQNSHIKKMGQKVSQPGDIVLTTKGTVGRVAIMPDSSPKFIYSPQVCYFRVNEKASIDRGFLYNWLKSDQFWQQASSLMSQTDMAAYLNMADIRSLRITLPELWTQRSIAAALGALDDKIAANERISEASETLGSALFEKFFSEASEFVLSDTPLPQGWSSSNLDHLTSEIETGRRPKGGIAKYETGIPSIGAESIRKLGKFDFSKVKYIPEDFFSSMKSGVIKDRDILVYKDGGKPGDFKPKVSMFGHGFPFNKMAINEHVYRVQMAPELGQNFGYYWLSSKPIMGIMRNLGTGVAIPGMNSTSFKSLPVVSPPDELVERFNDAVNPLTTSALKAASESRTLAELRDTLLPQLMSGKLRVKDAEKIVEDNV
ncbi:restriction endonuclease subunit S [Nocardiopsis dassonvillei]|uniref:restriction endonuclease subunit S n=1 Tax=Nocardiopsis dassonvillei TaxID=2014 RepID=UPI0036311C44